MDISIKNWKWVVDGILRVKRVNLEIQILNWNKTQPSKKKL